MAKKTSKKVASSIYDEFEPTPVKTLRSAKEKEDELITTRKSNFLTLDAGENKLRLYPKRKGIDENFYALRQVFWLPIKKDNGDIGRTTVKNSKIHAGTKKDIVEEYISLANRLFNTGDIEDSQKLEKISDFKNGISSQITFVCYAATVKGKKKKEFGLFEFNSNLKTELMKECFIEDEDEAVEIDPYTSPRDGKPVIISYSPKEKGAKRYSAKLSKFEMPLSAEELKEFKEHPAISNHPILKYDKKDFEKALECLEVFDEENEIDIFDSEEFQDLIKELRKEYKGISSDSDKKKTPKKKVSKKEVDDEDEGEDEDVEESDDDEEEESDDDDSEDDEDDDSEDDEDDDSDDSDEDSDDDDEEDSDDEEVEDDDDDEEEEEKPKRSKVTLADVKRKLMTSNKKPEKKEARKEKEVIQRSNLRAFTLPMFLHQQAKCFIFLFKT